MWRALTHLRTQLSVGQVERSAASRRSSALKSLSVLLSIPYAFHSPQVETWVNEFEFAASKIQYHAPIVPYMLPLLRRTVSAYEAGVLNGSYLSQACRATIDFFGAIEAARDAGIVNAEMNWLELGSHPICSSFIKHTIGPKAITIPFLRQGTDP